MCSASSWKAPCSTSWALAPYQPKTGLCTCIGSQKGSMACRRWKHLRTSVMISLPRHSSANRCLTVSSSISKMRALMKTRYRSSTQYRWPAGRHGPTQHGPGLGTAAACRAGLGLASPACVLGLRPKHGLTGRIQAVLGPSSTTKITCCAGPWPM